MMRKLLWVDSSAGLVIGSVVLLLARWLSGLYGMSLSLIIGIGVANVLYGFFSLFLASRQCRPRTLIALLVGANATWTFVCAITIALTALSASWIGISHLVAEGLFTGGLAFLEWRYRDLLASAA